MKMLFKSLISTAVLASAFAIPVAQAVPVTQANGITVDVEVTAPAANSVIAVESFPANIDLTMSFSSVNPNGGCVLSNLRQATVTATNLATGVVTNVYSGDPAFASNVCPSEKTFVWSVAGPGTYTLTVAANGGNGSDVDMIDVTIELALMTMEYPAPPAIANQYINADPTLKAAAPKKRGCVIAKIADQHAKYEAYGPKGGPYVKSKVESDVSTFFPLCK